MKSQYKGVAYKRNQKKYHSRLRINNEVFHLGSWVTERAAAIARDKECIKRGLMHKVQILKPKQ